MAAIIDVQDLWKVYPDGTQAVRGVSFSVEEGEFFGFLGPNGAGKSTTIKILITLLRASNGTATVLGHDVGKDASLIRARIGYAAQEVGLDDELTGRENLEIQGRLYHIPGPTLRQRVDEMLALVDLTADANRPAGSYSGGMRKRLDLATGLINQPRVLFLDEPTTGLDPQNRAGLWSYLERLNKEEGLTIFLTTHYLEEADRLADRIAIIDHGQIIASGTPAALKAEVGGDVIKLVFHGNGVDVAAQRYRAAEILQGMPAISGMSESEGMLVLSVMNGGRALPQILRHLDEAGIYVDDLSLTPPTLDDVFIKYTGERIRQDAPLQNWRNQRGGGFMRPGGFTRPRMR